MNPNALFAAAGQIQQCCREHGWAFCFIGGLAVLRWGDPRLTRDVDVLLIEANSVPIDVSLEALPFEQRATERAAPFEIGPG